MTLAALGITIEGKGVKEAPRDLNAVAAAADNAEKATNRLTPSSRQASDGVKRLGDTARTTDGALANLANRSLTGFNAIAARAAEQAAYVAREMEKITMHDLRADDIQAFGQEMDRLRAKFNPLFAASKQYEAGLDEINRAHTLGAISAQEQAAAIARLDAQYEAAARAANTLAVANKSAASSFHTTNMLFQMQDIGMMTAMGQSPFALALQQGPQVVGIMHQLGNGRAIVQALGGAIVGLLNPLSLATIAAIGLGSAFVQYLMGINSDLKSASDVIKDQNNLIAQVAERWGDAVPSLKAYVDQLKRASDEDDLNMATEEMIKRAYSQAAGTINDMRVELAAARIDLVALGASSSEIDRLQGAFNTLYSGLLDNTATTDDLENAMAALAGTTGADTAPSMAGFASVLQSLVPVLAAAAAEAARLRAERDKLIMEGPDPQTFYSNRDFIAEQERLNGLTTEQLNLEREIARIKGDAKSSNVLLSDAQALRLAEESLAADERRRKIMEANRAGAKSSLKERNAYDELVKGANQFVQAQQLEQQALGMTAEAAQRLRFESDLLNKAKEAGINLDARVANGTMTVRGELAALAEQMAATEAQTKMLTQAANDNAALWGAAQDGVSSVIKTWIKGGDVLDAFADKLGQIGDMLIDMAVRDLFANAFNPGVAGGGLFDFIGNIFGGFRANGGPVEPGKIYRVNENTPNSEWFTPTVPGTIIPNETVIDHTRPYVANQNQHNDNWPSVQIVDQRGRNAPAIQQERDMGPNGEKRLRLIIRDEVQQAQRRGALGF